MAFVRPSVLTVREVFARRGLRCTRQRERIYEALVATDTHPTAEDLFQTVRRTEPGLSLATVYNTLDVLAQEGLCRRLACAAGGSACRFDAVMEDHAHLVGADGRITDVPADLSRRLLGGLPADALAELERRTGIRVGGVSVHVQAQARVG